MWRPVLLVLLVVFAAQAQPLQPQESVAAARSALQQGLPEEALPLLQGEAVGIAVTRLEALVEADRLTQARTLLRDLERREHGDFPEPYDYRFYLYRGQIELYERNQDLARKNFREALRRADSPAEKLRAWDELCELELSFDNLEQAQEAFSGSGPLVSEVQDARAMADHLMTSSNLLYDLGELAASTTANQAARLLYLNSGDPIRAARSLRRLRRFPERANDHARGLLLGKQALEELLERGAYPEAADLMEDLRWSYSMVGSNPAGRDLESYLEAATWRFPSGELRGRARLAYAKFLSNAQRDPTLVLKVYQELLQYETPALRCLGYQGLAAQQTSLGNYEQALRSLQQAMTLAEPQNSYDVYGFSSPGPVLLRMAYVEKTRHNYQRALELAREGILAQPGSDWLYWRIDAHHQALMSAMQMYDTAAASEQLKQSLEEIDRIPHPSARSGALTTILAALLLNQSVNPDVIDPGLVLLADYSEIAQDVLKAGFGSPQRIAESLAVFDAWHERTRRTGEKNLEPLALVYKGALLEALDRLEEARAALESGLEVAERNDAVTAQMLGGILLARVTRRLGGESEAVRHVQQAARASLRANPVAARFYHLVAGSVEREAGLHEEALSSFAKAAELEPERSWQANYGRALTLERMGRLEDARQAVASALKELQEAGKPVSVAQLQVTEARLLTHSGKHEQALPLFSEAFDTLGNNAAADLLGEAALHYTEALIAVGEMPQAFEIASQTLEQLAQWHSLSYGRTHPLFEQAVSLALDLGKNERALELLEMSHSAELLEGVKLSRVGVSDPATQELMQDLQRLKDRLSQLNQKSQQAESSAARESLGQLLAQTRVEFFAKLADLKKREPEFEALVQLTGSQLSAVQELLSPESVLIEYFPARDTLYLFVVTRDQLTLHQVSLSREELVKLIDAYQGLLTRPGADSEKRRDLGRKLHTLLVEAAGSRLNGFSNLRIVPSGPLWNVPFSSLPDSNGLPLNETFEVSYVTSSDILRLQKNRGRTFPKPRNALLVNGSKNLAGTRAEIGDLSRVLPASKVLKSHELDLDSFKEASRGRDLIHLASHSRVSPEPARSFVEMGAQRLTLERIYGLELEPGSLVVLSSCSTQVGSGPPGKEVTSLAAAFSIAGASTLVASRWEIDDRSTRLFFSHFYQGLMNGLTRGEALRYAEQETAKTHPDPYHWAGFSLLGDPG